MSTAMQMKVKTPALAKPSFTPVQTGLLQRKCACGGTPGVDGECEECRAKRLGLQRSAANPSTPGTVPPIVHDVLRSPGQPLDTGTRAFMEPRFGHDFSNVRVHSDVRAAESARSVSALAYTVGKDVVFGTGQYAPNTTMGRKLLAHELTHTIQQPPGLTKASQGELKIGIPGSAHELEAEHVAKLVTNEEKGNAQVKSTVNVASTLQRELPPITPPAQAPHSTPFPDCNEKQIPDLKAALTQAHADLDVAITKLKVRPLTKEVQNALWLAFRDNSIATADALLLGLTKIKDRLSPEIIECEQPESLSYSVGPLFCSGDTQAYASHFGIGHIHLCMDQWKENTLLYRVRTLIHEGSHLSNHIEDEAGYFGDTDNCEERLQQSKSAKMRLNNADSQACLVYYLTHSAAEDLSATYSQFHDPALHLAQKPEGVIDLTSKDVKGPRFTLGGIPSAGGFQIRWILADDSDRRYLLEGLPKGDPFQFGSTELPIDITYIPSKTRELLRSRKINTGKVLCRVLIPNEGERLFTLEVYFRT